MKAIIVSQTGGPEVLTLQERPLPIPTLQDVLIRVHAAGVNRADLLMRQGRYGVSAQAPAEPLGLEVAGVVEQIGSPVSRWKVGDRVCALIRYGGYAEYAPANVHHCLPIPPGLSFEEAACLPETCMTVWNNVFQRMHLQAGENLLVHGGTSGIGVTAIQLAKAFGAQVFATAGTEEKCRFAEALGAVKCVNYKIHPFEEVLKPYGIDAILDYIGGDYTAKNIRLLRPEGRLCFIAGLGGVQTHFNIMEVMSKRLTITGSMLAPRDIEFKAALTAEVEKRVWPLIASGQFKPILYKTFPLSEAAEAHRLMESSEHIGKIVLVIP
ncbi:NAD(P)H-quinone oxidoreductase [Runella slithyformis]|uniref:NAD(P)H quinone oxidoreductase, PIG3 family n=1 Tax=Runella slithyformis (strain ATCC 29530 / DSM 19594 / LMG 11500 / NCIMB 11436 / LSU 4) TaxID=761193 RepID=A0A7U3ZI34_RUNSL|nr:NAD(P)H-quinone oxidoreductase [Runella slithyformis]AEI47601.1 NAD(P)H quinone oxidoreductase, PIG3 family [Runella slithyformis DSM 19594]